MASTFHLELVSPEKLLLSENVSEIILPAREGEMTVLALHAPTMTTLKPGVATVRRDDGRTDRYAIFGGFADITPEACILLAEDAVHVDDFNREDLARRIEKARRDLEKAESEEERASILQMIDQLTTLEGAIIPA